MSNLSTLPKGDSAWLLRKAIERIIQQISVLETNIGSSTTGNSANTQVIFNDNGVLRGDSDLTFNSALNKLIATNIESSASLVVGTSATITGDLTVDTSTLKVDSTNNRVGIGTASPSNTLTVRGTQDAGIEINSADSNSSRLISAYDPAGGRFYINCTKSGSGTTLPLDFLIQNSIFGRFTASGEFLTGGKTSATANGGDVQVSSGITFPATQVAKSDANTLDDYEEGTFTPVIAGSTTAGTATYVGRTGKYTKIGNLVNVQIYIDYNSHTGVGDTRISGLPFTNSSAFAAATVGYANAITVSANYYLGAYVDAGNSWILLNQIPVAGGTNQTVPIDPAGTLVISAVYTV